MISLDTFLKILPWLATGLLLFGGGLLGWKIGIPAAKIASLEQRIKLLEYQLREAHDRAKLAEESATALGTKLDALTSELATANRQVRALLDTIELKAKLGHLADIYQPERNPAA